MRTTLTLDKDVAAKLRTEMRRSGRSFKEVVNDLLRLALNTRRESKPAKPFRVQTRHLGQRPGFNLDKISELIEQIEGSLHR